MEMVSPERVDPSLSAGAFPVKKDGTADRLIGDRRPWNSLEELIGDPQLPRVTDLLHWFLPPEEVLRVHSRDLKDMYYQFRVPSQRLEKQAIGPRIPARWLDDLQDTSRDEWDAARDGRWAQRDLYRQRSSGAGSSDVASTAGLVQPVLVAIMMGDLNGVTAAQWAHQHGLQSAGLLPADLRLAGPGPALLKTEMHDIYIDDYGAIAAIPASAVKDTTGKDFDDMAEVDAFYERRGIPQSTAKAVCGEVVQAQLWGAELRCLEGTVAAPLLRRIGCACLGLLWVASGCRKKEAQSVLGCMVTSFLFRRDLFCACGQVYSYFKRLPARRKVVPPPDIADEIIAAAFLQLGAVSDLRMPLLPAVAASDASLFAGGAVWAEVPWKVACKLYDFCERRGTTAAHHPGRVRGAR